MCPRRDTDWQLTESVRAKLRTSIKGLPLKHGCPPDREPAATDLILQHAELMAEQEAV
jgi:type I restriction enzyme R subunit